MRIWILVCPKMKVSGMALFPFILVRRQSDITDSVLMNHEKIHLKQQLELLILPFYMLYFANYLVNLIICGKHDEAYRNIVFEKEAYRNDGNLDYLKQRKFFAFLNYFGRN